MVPPALELAREPMTLTGSSTIDTHLCEVGELMLQRVFGKLECDTQDL